MIQKGCREDIAGTGRVYLLYRIGFEAFGYAMSEESCAVPAICCDEQGYLHATV